MYFLYYTKILCMIHVYSVAFFKSLSTYIRCMLTNDQPTMAMFVSEVDSGTKCCFCFIWHTCLPPLIYDMLFCSPTPAPPPHFSVGFAIYKLWREYNVYHKIMFMHTTNSIIYTLIVSYLHIHLVFHV